MAGKAEAVVFVAALAIVVRSEDSTHPTSNVQVDSKH